MSPARALPSNGLARPWSPSLLIRLSIALHVAGLLWIVVACAVSLGVSLWAPPEESPWAQYFGAQSPWLRSAALRPVFVIPAVLVACALNHLVLSLCGMWPRSTALGPNHTRLPAIARQRAEIAITIDDGPDPEVTPRVLDILRAHGAHATFFLIGDRAREHPDIVRRLLGEGHEIGNHTHGHPLSFSFLGPKALSAEIARAQQLYHSMTGSAPRCFRAPAGIRSPLLEPVLSRQGLTLCTWTRRGYDTRIGDADLVLARLIGRDGSLLAAGDILLLHDGNAARDARGRPVIEDVLPRLLDHARASGLRSVTLSEGGLPPARAQAGGAPLG